MAGPTREGARRPAFMQAAPFPPAAPAPRILVTGASGFIGTRLVARLQGRGHPVVALDLEPPRVRLEGVAYHRADVREPLAPEFGAGAARIYNLAAVHRTPGHPAQAYYETNLLGALNVTALAEACGIATVVFTSSISVYGPSEQAMTETSPLHPTSPYGRSKRMAELLHEAWQGREAGRRLVIVRPGVVFGPGERGNFTYLARALARGAFFYPGRKDTIKSGGYVDELLEALDFALAQTDARTLFNFAYPALSTTEDIVHAFARVCGFKGRHATLPVAPLYVAAGVFEVANRLGLPNPVHRERVLKLVKSTKVTPGWLQARGYPFRTDLEQALTAWRDETDGTFV